MRAKKRAEYGTVMISVSSPAVPGVLVNGRHRSLCTVWRNSLNIPGPGAYRLEIGRGGQIPDSCPRLTIRRDRGEIRVKIEHYKAWVSTRAWPEFYDVLNSMLGPQKSATLRFKTTQLF